MKTLTVGMATHGEPRDVWHTVSALAEYFPAVRDRVEFLVVDNSPRRDPNLAALLRSTGGRYFHRPDLWGTSKPRDAVFRFSKTPWTMCIDSHVLLGVGALDAAVRYADAHPDSNDLIQGPLKGDDAKWYSTHWTQPAPPGLWGEWAQDPRGELRPAFDWQEEFSKAEGQPFEDIRWQELSNAVHAANRPAFEIGMMGLGLFMCRTAVWPGFNIHFHGFGGEEGYLHELFRRRGGKALCLPDLTWRHLFRDGNINNRAYTVPYPRVNGDHLWNLLVGHAELGIDANEYIRAHFAKSMPEHEWSARVQAARLGAANRDGKRMRLLALWYSDNTAPASVLRASAKTVLDAAEQTWRHDVTVRAVSWDAVAGVNWPDGTWERFAGHRERKHATIVAQWEQAIAGLDVSRFDGVVFCEHDVLYPPHHFDRMGDGLSTGAPVVSNLDYEGLNATGWQAVKARHEPLHQLALRTDVFGSNLARAKADCIRNGMAFLEPNHAEERRDWLRLPPLKAGDTEIKMPSVHINHEAGRFTSHGEEVYFPDGYGFFHPFWGPAQMWWPGQLRAPSPSGAPAAQAAPQPKGCTSCPGTDPAETVAKWYENETKRVSDFREHLATVRDLAAKCKSVAELSAWNKPFSCAVAHGLPADGTFTSVCRAPKPEWKLIGKHMGDRFVAKIADPDAAGALANPVDMLFIDTQHTAQHLQAALDRYAPLVQKYIVVHCTVTYGEHGDKDRTQGVLHALRHFCDRNRQWSVLYKTQDAHGLIVLSVLEEDRKDVPSLGRRMWNYGTALLRHARAGQPLVTDAAYQKRMELCVLCPERAMDKCSACGCPLEDKLMFATETCGLAKKGKPPLWEPVTDPADIR